jgi:integrase
LIFDLGRDESGQRQQKFMTFRGTKAEADKKLRETLQQMETGGYVEAGKETVGSFMQRWLKDYAATNTAPRTSDGYRGIVKRYVDPAFGSVLLTRLTPRHVQGLYTGMLERGLSPTTVLQTHRVLREALTHAVRWGLLSRNVTDAIDPPRKATREMTPMDEEQARRFMEAVEDSEWGLPFKVLLYTGLRRSELTGLKWSNIDLERAALSVTQTVQRLKGKGLVDMDPKSPRSKRRVSLPSSAVAALRQQRSKQAAQRLLAGPAWLGHDYVFTTAEGRPIAPDRLSAAFQRISNSLGFKNIRLHDLRHTHATLMLKMGIHPKIVSERLGHASIGITLDTYSHVLPGLQEAAAEAFEEALSVHS